MTITLTMKKPGRSFGFLSFLALLFVLCTFVFVLKTAIDAWQEKKREEWPSVMATITQRTARKSAPGRRGEWYIELELR